MVKFGAFADVHYAKNLTIGKRYCDLSLMRVKKIVHDFNNRNLDFCICLGDIITSVQDYDIDKLNIKRVLDEFNNFDMPSHIILGNHDLEAMSKSDFYTIFDKDTKSTYYSFAHENSKFIVLDANYLADNSDYCKGNYNWTESYVCDEQITWLENELNACKEKNIIIFTHQNLDYRMNNGVIDACVIKNHKEVAQILESSKKRITVIQGHYHNGDYQEINNITYITLKALCVSDDTSYIPRIIVTIEKDVFVEYLE